MNNMKNNYKKEIIDRLLLALDCKKVNDLADILNVSPSNLNGYIDRGSYIKLVHSDLLKRGININWIKTGQGDMHESQSSSIAETYSSYANHPPTIKISDPLIQKTAAILESTTVYATALKSNIEAFHHAMTCEEQLVVSNKRIDVLEENIKSIEQRLPVANES